MPRPFQWTPADAGEMLRAYRLGLNLRQLGRAYGFDKSTIARAIRSVEMPPAVITTPLRYVTRPRRYIVPRDRATIRAAYRRGVSLAALAVRYHCSIHLIRRILGEHNDVIRGRLGFSHPRVPIAKRAATIRDLEWIAGFCEGEATFGTATPLRNGTTSETVAVTQVDPIPLQRLVAVLGGRRAGPYQPAKTPGREHWKVQPFYRWAVSGARARGVMLTLYALLSPRRQAQIRHALTANGDPLGGRAPRDAHPCRRCGSWERYLNGSCALCARARNNRRLRRSFAMYLMWLTDLTAA